MSSGKKLLIIDDDPDQLLIVSTILRRKCGCEIVTAKNINEGLQVFASEQISLVISDVAMPGMSIEELIENIRKQGSVVPIIVVTSAYEEKKEALLLLGASMFIPKQELGRLLAPAVLKLIS